MSVLSNTFYKRIVLFAFVLLNDDCLYAPIYEDVYEELHRGSQIAVYAWHTKSNDNIVIKDGAGHHVATIFTLRYEHKGKIGVFLNRTDGTRVSMWPFDDQLGAKEWVISQAIADSISLAKE